MSVCGNLWKLSTRHGFDLLLRECHATLEGLSAQDMPHGSDSDLADLAVKILKTS